MNVNKVFLYGNLTRDPDLRQLPSGMSVAEIGIATNRYYNNQQGERVEEVEYHSIVLFGRLADLAQQYLRKGSGLFVEGRLRTRSWDDRDTGAKRYKTEIVGEQMQFGPRRDGGGGGGAAAHPSTQEAVSDAPSQAPAAPSYPEGSINPDDIPF